VVVVIVHHKPGELSPLEQEMESDQGNIVLLVATLGTVALGIGNIVYAGWLQNKLLKHEIDSGSKSEVKSLGLELIDHLEKIRVEQVSIANSAKKLLTGQICIHQHNRNVSRLKKHTPNEVQGRILALSSIWYGSNRTPVDEFFVSLNDMTAEMRRLINLYKSMNSDAIPENGTECCVKDCKPIPNDLYDEIRKHSDRFKEIHSEIRKQLVDDIRRSMGLPPK